FHDLRDVQRAPFVNHFPQQGGVRGTHGPGRRRRRSEALRQDQPLAHLRRDLPRQFAVGRVARLDRDEVRQQRTSYQRQVPEQVQHFVPDKFLGIPQRLRRQHRVVPNHHGVFQAPPSDQTAL